MHWLEIDLRIVSISFLTGSSSSLSSSRSMAICQLTPFFCRNLSLSGFSKSALLIRSASIKQLNKKRVHSPTLNWLTISDCFLWGSTNCNICNEQSWMSVFVASEFSLFKISLSAACSHSCKWVFSSSLFTLVIKPFSPSDFKQSISPLWWEARQRASICPTNPPWGPYCRNFSHTHWAPALEWSILPLSASKSTNSSSTSGFNMPVADCK